MRKLVWSEFSSDNATETVALLISERTQSLLLAALEYVQKPYVWEGNFDEIDAAIGEVIQEILEVRNAEMSCEEIADCIETELQSGNAELINELTVVINESGFGNPNHVNPTQTTIYDRPSASTLTEEIKELDDCNLNRLWGGIRHGIIARLDDNVKDMLEDAVVITDLIQRAQYFLDTVPVLGDLAEALVAQITELAPDLLAIVESYSSTETLDEMSCELFDMVCAECRYPTYEELFEYFINGSLAGLPSAESLTLEAIAEAILELLTSPSEIGYKTLMVWQLFVLNLNALFNGQNGFKAIERMATLGEGEGDNDWQTLCDGCGESYSIYTWDYTHSQYDSKSAVVSSANFGGTWVSGKGWRMDKTTSTGGVLAVVQPFDPTWKVRSVSWKTNVARSAYDSHLTSLRTIANSQTGATSLNMTIDNPTDTTVRCRQGLLSLANFYQVAIQIIDDPVTTIYLERLTIVFDAGFAPDAAQPTADPSACEQS